MNLKSRFFIFLAAFVLYASSAGAMLGTQSTTPQYVYLANSFLQGKTYLAELPNNTYDLIFYQNHWYVPGAMAPALLLLPFVAIFGLQTSDIMFGVIIGAINIVLMYDLLDHLAVATKHSTRNWLTLLFAAGTVNWWVSSLGTVWFNAQVVSVLFMTLFVRETLINKNSYLCGLWLGLSILSRPSTIFAATFYITFVVLTIENKKEIFRKLFPFFIMVGTMIVIMFLYNFLRFGSPFNFGYTYVQGDTELITAYSKYGGFNPIFMPCNIYISLLGLPNILGEPFPGTGQICWHLIRGQYAFSNLFPFINPLGMSIFLTTPMFIYIFKAKIKIPLVKAAWIGILSVMVPLWMYHNTGFIQFGYRYILDIIPILFVLLFWGVPKIGLAEKFFIIISVFVNFIGMLVMFQVSFGSNWFAMWVKLLVPLFSK